MSELSARSGMPAEYDHHAEEWAAGNATPFLVYRAVMGGN